MRRTWTLWTSCSIETVLAISDVGCQLDEPARANDSVDVSQALSDDLAGTYVPGRVASGSQLVPAVNAIGDTLPGLHLHTGRVLESSGRYLDLLQTEDIRVAQRLDMLREVVASIEPRCEAFDGPRYDTHGINRRWYRRRGWAGSRP